ncbi:MAG: glycosyltransferase family 2 protein [Methylophilaceae bacterium]|nr:glycosyltransferase family 2 protein [Methylophilaceae bacterium]MBL6750732.1 glycosyltransferase family 2 protein [Nevskia sp.]
MQTIGPRFSVLVTSYNYRRYLVEALESVLAQSSPPLELVIVDDGSTDGSRELLQDEFARRATVRLVFKENGGQLSALAAGVAECRGDIICFLDADDFWEPDYLAQLAATYREHPEADLVFANLRYFGAREGYWSTDTCDRDCGLTALAAVFGRQWLGSPTSALSMRSTLARRVVDLPPDFHADWRTRADDCLVFGAAALGGRKHYRSIIAGGYRSHDANHWLSVPESRTDALAYIYRVQRLLAHYRLKCGFDAKSLCYCKLEFKTQPTPNRESLHLYLKLLRQAPMPWITRVEHNLSMRRHYLRKQNGAKQRN